MQTVKDYAEVRNDYFDETDNFWRIDAWETDDDNEDGKVVAYVHTSGDAVICEPKARNSALVKEAIKELQQRIKEKSKIPDDYYCVHMAIEGRYDAYVPYGPLQEMIDAATQAYYEADFADLHETDMKIVYVEDPNGNFVYEA